MNTKDLITQAEAARRLNISRQSVSIYVQRGTLKSYAIGGRIFVFASDVEQRLQRLENSLKA